MRREGERGEASFGVCGRKTGRGIWWRRGMTLRADDTKGRDHGSVCSTKGVWH